MTKRINFQDYQIAFARHIRDPDNISPPEYVSEPGMAVYREVVFNNIESLVSACFPVLKKILGDEAWLRLVRDFFKIHSCKTPLFREIPEEFLAYINCLADLPPYVQGLAHYEWVELHLTYMDVAIDWSKIDTDTDLLDGILAFVPAMSLLSYDFPVHQISPAFIPQTKLENPVQLLVYRDAQDIVRFVELNPMTASLIKGLQEGKLTPRQLFIEIASAMKLDKLDLILDFGSELLRDLKVQGAILGLHIA